MLDSFRESQNCMEGCNQLLLSLTAGMHGVLMADPSCFCNAGKACVAKFGAYWAKSLFKSNLLPSDRPSEASKGSSVDLGQLIRSLISQAE